MENLQKRVISQFDTLVPFLALSHEEVFNLIKKDYSVWFPESSESGLPDSYSNYQIQVVHSAFLLGYSYFEAFLADLVRDIYLSRPKMLPKDKQLKYAEILNTSDYHAILQLMIEREIIDLFYRRMDEVVEYFEEKLKIKWSSEHKKKILYTSYLRNCILHNLSIVDHRLAKISEYEVGHKIRLTPSNVHSFGIMARNLVEELYKQAADRYFKKL